MPFTTPSVSSIAFKIGVIAFVVQDAAEKIFHQDCIRFGLHREQYLVLLYRERLIKLYLLLQKLSDDSRPP
jgi:hypothetical protein